MKVLFLLTLVSTFCASFAIYGESDDVLLQVLTSRAPTTKQNPDGEDTFLDRITNAQSPRSEILPFEKNGVKSPDTAKTRIFDWDMTCTDAGDRLKITNAFADALNLAGAASKALGILRKSLPKGDEVQEKSSKPIAENQNYISTVDPAFTQMFFALDGRILDVKGVFDKIQHQVLLTPDKRTKDSKGGLRFICDKGGKIMDGNGESFCGKDTQAATNRPGEDSIEDKYVFAHSSSIVFCPPFFDDSKFPNADALATEPKYRDHTTLDKIDCRERIMLHELTHLGWTTNFPGATAKNPLRDYIGFLNCAKLAGAGLGSTRAPNWRGASTNPDNYAWYAIYSFWNRMYKYEDQSNICLRDAWPKDVKKPNPTKF